MENIKNEEDKKIFTAIANSNLMLQINLKKEQIELNMWIIDQYLSDNDSKMKNWAKIILLKQAIQCQIDSMRQAGEWV